MASIKSRNIDEISRKLNAFNEEPLSKEMVNCTLPPGFKYPTLEPYDEVSDPTTNCWQLTTIIENYASDIRGIVRLFKNMLRGATITWYNNLQPESIESWYQLMLQLNI